MVEGDTQAEPQEPGNTDGTNSPTEGPPMEEQKEESVPKKATENCAQCGKELVGEFLVNRELKFCNDSCFQLFLTQAIKDREISIEKAIDNVKWLGEELKYKENQLKTGILEENISELYSLVSFPIDKKKPKHVIEIEIGMLIRGILAKEQSLKIMKRLQVEDKKKCHQD